VAADLGRAGLVLVLLHGRGHAPGSMERLAASLGRDDLAVLAPEAPGRSWYPGRFFEPRAVNEPHLGAGLAAVEAALGQVAEAGVAPERVVLGGFSQGACLACDFVARAPRRLGALVVLCGALIGTGEELARPPAGALPGLPVLITGTEGDDWVPADAVRDSAERLADAGAHVDLRIHPPAPHEVHADEVAALRRLLERL
jgi:phospholipase/carboxylesterase